MYFCEKCSCLTILKKNMDTGEYYMECTACSYKNKYVIKEKKNVSVYINYMEALDYDTTLDTRKIKCKNCGETSDMRYFKKDLKNIYKCRKCNSFNI